MQTRRWINKSQPQTLLIGTYLLYFEAFFSIITFNPVGILIGAVAVAAGYGIANEFKWGWYLGVGVSVFGLLFYLPGLFNLGAALGSISFLIGLAFAIAQLVLLIHPMSRDYVRIWFQGGMPGAQR